MKKFIIAGLLIFLAPIVLATVSSTTTQQSFTGAGSSSLSVTLPFHDNDHIQVWIQDTATTPATLTQLVYGAGAGKFTITGGDPGTTVVLGTALTATQTAIVKRVVPLTQTTDYVDNGPFRAETHEKALDRLTMQVQQVDDEVGKKIGLSPASTATTPVFPDPVANTFVQYDTGGSTLTLSPASPASGDVLKFDGSAWAKYGLDAALALKADSSDLTAHTTDTANPHATTAAQVGAPDLGQFAAHVGNNMNPHVVTPAQVGADFAQWNASKIVDKTVDASAIADGRVLTYSSGSDTLIYSPAPLSPSLMDGHIFVGNASNQAVDVAMSGDATISNTGVVTVTQAANATTAGNVTGIVDIANGGTGQSTAMAALTALTPSAVTGQVLKWNGTEWAAASDDASGSSPVSFYFHNQASDIGGYETLLTYADGSTEVNEATVVSSATSPALIDSYGSSAAIGGTQIDGGVWTFDFYARVDSAVGTTRLQAKVFTRTALGVETERFTVQTNDINNTSATPMLYEVQTVQNAIPINATDRLVVKVYAVTDSVPARTLTWTYEGDTYWSHFHTPLIRRHNDLAGLNEGDYKHLTSAEYTNSILPSQSSNSGKYLTTNGTSPSWATVSASGATDMPTELTNLGISATISSNQLVVALKGKDGNDPSGSNAVKVAFRNPTATSGTYGQSTFDSATSITLAAADSISFVAGQTVWVYLIADTTKEICLSTNIYDEGSLQSASALTGGADTTAALWCTSAHTSKPIRLVGKLTGQTWSNPNWAAPTTVSIAPILQNQVSTSAAGGERVERAYIVVSGGTPTVSRQSGDWVSVTDGGTGITNVNFKSGYFSAAPTCVCNRVEGGSDSNCSLTTDPTTSTVQITTRNNSTGSAVDNQNFHIVCMGPR